MDAKLRNGLTAGFAATVVFSVLLIMKSAMGMMPELDPVGMLASMMSMPQIVGWIGHFLIGTVLWGGIYGLFNASIPGGSHLAKGMVLGVAAWLVMMVILMPMAGFGLFGASLGIMAAVLTLVMHLIFGAVLGGMYQWLEARAGTAEPA